jgi:glycosyltransferase involved in cell wall biosynthesis
MAGIPTLATNLPAMKEIIEKYQIGETISIDSNPMEIAEKIKYMAQSENYEQYNNACKNASNQLSFESQENVIRSIFE